MTDTTEPTLWAVSSGKTQQAVHSQVHAEAMVEDLASMGITVEAVEWSGTAEEHSACMAASASFAGLIQ